MHKFEKFIYICIGFIINIVMKYLYLYIILYIVFPIKIMAQESNEWPDENIYVGCSYVRSSLGTKKGILYYSIKSVEVVNGIKFLKMYIHFDELPTIKGGTHEMSYLDETTCSDALSLWQDGGKMYCQTEDGTQTWLIFDFSLETGDTFTNYVGECYIVKETTMLDAPKRKKLLLVSEDGTKEDTWIEGIGSVQYGFLPAYIVRAIKDFQYVEAPLYINLWMAGEPVTGTDDSLSICQSINDEYFKLVSFHEITDEDMTYDDLPNPRLTCSFVGDSLWVHGYYPLNLYQSFIAASITGNQIDISFHQVVALDVVKGYRPAKIDVHIPGFKPGTYQVGLPGQEQVQLVCNGVNEPVAFTEGQMATIVLPTEPDASKGKYYRLDRVEGNEIVFEQELQPCAHVPYIIVPSEDFNIEVDAMELEGLRCDTASVEGISFIGTYQKDEVESQEGFYIELIDTTPDCSLSGNKLTIGALRAYLLVRWDDPYNHGGTKVPAEKMQIVLRDDPNSIQMVNRQMANTMTCWADKFPIASPLAAFT